MFNFSTKTFDFVAIGDITTDAFIQLDKDYAHISTDPETGREKLCMNFGDKLPYKNVTVVPAVGNSPNASVSAARLGLSSTLVTNVGNDDRGKEDMTTLRRNGVDTSFVKVHKSKNTNYHYVLRYGAERTILVKHEEYPYRMPNIGSPKWVYLSSLGENSIPFHHEIAQYIQKHPKTKLAFQPGTFQIEIGYEALRDVYVASDLFFSNKEEAQRILGKRTRDITTLLREMRDLGPDIAVITDGPRGAYVYDGSEMWHNPMYPDPAPPVDRTGAGDSFSSTFTSALALDMDISEALMWGPINSMSVVQYIGAQEGLLSRSQLEKFLKEAPADYKPEKIQ